MFPRCAKCQKRQWLSQLSPSESYDPELISAHLKSGGTSDPPRVCADCLQKNAVIDPNKKFEKLLEVAYVVCREWLACAPIVDEKKRVSLEEYLATKRASFEEHVATRRARLEESVAKLEQARRTIRSDVLIDSYEQQIAGHKSFLRAANDPERANPDWPWFEDSESLSRECAQNAIRGGGGDRYQFSKPFNDSEVLSILDVDHRKALRKIDGDGWSGTRYHGSVYRKEASTTSIIIEWHIGQTFNDL